MNTLQNNESKVKSDSISKKKRAFSIVNKATNPDIDLYGGEENEKLQAPIPLGLHDKSVVIWSRVTRSIIVASATDIKSPQILSMFCGKDWLIRFYSKIDERTGIRSIDFQTASLDMSWKAATLGYFSHSDSYATGCWRSEDDGLIINSGDFCVDHVGNDVERIDLTQKRSAVYTTQSKFSMPRFVSESAEDAKISKKIFEDLSTWRYDYDGDIGNYITIGWIVSAVYCTALNTRPSLWTTGDAGTGKTMLFYYIRDLLGKAALASESVTAAAIRQTIDDSSVPVILDEFEVSGTHQNVGQTRAILKTLRAAYSARGVTLKGTSDQRGKQYREQYPFALFSVSNPVLESADAGRIIKLRMRSAKYEKEVPSALNLTAEERGRFMWSIWRRWDLYCEILKATIKEYGVQEKQADAREKDAYCTVIAGAVLMYSIIEGINSMNPELTKGIANIIRVTLESMREELEATRAQRKDYEIVYNEIMETKIRVEYTQRSESSGLDNTRAETMTIGMAVTRAEDGDEFADNSLRMLGIRARLTVKDSDGTYTAIACKNIELAKLLAGTRWRLDGSWAEPLKATPGCIKNHPVRFSVTQVKAVLIPSKTE